jgi:hypothetical protein
VQYGEALEAVVLQSGKVTQTAVDHHARCPAHLYSGGTHVSE